MSGSKDVDRLIEDRFRRHPQAEVIIKWALPRNGRPCRPARPLAAVA
ncbi:hypothetical protein [Saccharothrix violaceirubra]|uniref:Uncharacterized protein n=1 Tax=Saccharothrix violaceirubra TaxID=413306 RepID=A0A7W7T2U1_9PSEU|nr:hypothetical protein [Saccharothrix violaceirubra]MBB4965533.1 hypothetical protein [Saccharothrix violaceirubra]